MERDVLLAERILLQTLSFDLNVVHPYQFFRQIIGKDLKGEVYFFKSTVCVCPQSCSYVQNCRPDYCLSHVPIELNLNCFYPP